MPERIKATSTSSSGFSRTSTSASTPHSLASEQPVFSLRVHRKKPSSVLSDLFYRAIVSPTSDSWDMLCEYSECVLVGKGSYGEVVRAKTDSGTLVAIKRVDILEDHHPSDWENGLRLLREIFFLKNLKHPNVCNLISIFPNCPSTTCSSFTSVNLVTPFCKEGSLNGYCPRSIREILGIQLKIMNGLSYLHANGIVHRDIKRENIFIHRTSNNCIVGKVVIGDFGLSRSTRPGMTSEVVTKPYRCPSLILGETNYGPEVDVFAAGIVLLEMLSGKCNSTLLPNRKLGTKSFLRFQIALTGFVRGGSRILELADKMHLDLDEVADGVHQGTDFDDQVVREWGNQVWKNIEEVYSPSCEVIGLTKGMVAFDPETRLSVPTVLSNAVFDPVRKYLEESHRIETSVVENYDEEISRAGESDEARAAAVKAAIWELMKGEPVIGDRSMDEFFPSDYEPVAKRTRGQKSNPVIIY
jgi:serine/threonine protein kinase